jgi:RHS repeat-associated protein
VVEKNAAGTIVQQTDFTYDVFDRRIGKSVDADGAGPGAATVQRFVYDGDHIVLEFDGSSASDLTHRYLHGPVVDQILADEVVTSLSQAGSVRWPLADHQGTIRDLVDSSASLLNHVKYDSFGKVTAETNAAVDFLFAYTGREKDEETGLHYYRARYYDPAVGRFVSEDPIGFLAGDANLNRYVGNGPTNANDWSGHEEDRSFGRRSLEWLFSWIPGVRSFELDVKANRDAISRLDEQLRDGQFDNGETLTVGRGRNVSEGTASLMEGMARASAEMSASAGMWVSPSMYNDFLPALQRNGKLYPGSSISAKVVAPSRQSGCTRMQDYIPELGKPSFPATTRLTPQQVFALQENLQAVVNQSIPGYRQLIASGRPRAEVLKGLQNQMNLLRWRFIDQLPGGREAIQGILREFPEITFPH